MTTHRPHPDRRIGELQHMLYDDCERCDQQAETITSLDNRKLSWFWNAMHMLKHEGHPPPRDLTTNEWKVINQMYTMAVVLERLTGIWPSPQALTYL